MTAPRVCSYKLTGPPFNDIVHLLIFLVGIHERLPLNNYRHGAKEKYSISSFYCLSFIKGISLYLPRLSAVIWDEKGFYFYNLLSIGLVIDNLSFNIPATPLFF